MERVDRIFRALWPSDFPSPRSELYGIFDGARDPRIHELLSRGTSHHACLYDGPLAPVLARAAPHLLQVHSHDPVARRLVELGWGASWGVFLHSTAPLAELRRHFRRLLRVRDEQGRLLLFRFYDPRVLRVYLPTCTGDELDRFFGPVQRFCIESPGGAVMDECLREHGRLRQRGVPC